MTRVDLLRLLLQQARQNGFRFREWYVGRLGLPWTGAEQSIDLLNRERRYYALLFSHDFAQSFWKPGEEMCLEIPAQSFFRRRPDGSLTSVRRKPYFRRRTQTNSWKYHLQKMSLADDPLRYLRRFVRVREDLDPEPPRPKLKIVPPPERDPRFIIDEEDLLPDDDE